MSQFFALLIAATIRTTVLLVGTACLAALLRKRTAAMQHAIWTAAMAASLSIPLLSATLPKLGVRNPVPLTELASAAWTRIGSFGLGPRADGARATSFNAPTDARTAAPRFDLGAIFTSGPSEVSAVNRTVEVVLLVWLVGIALALSRILRSTLGAMRLRRSATEVSDERIASIWMQVQRGSRSRKVLVVESDSVTAPGTAGILQPTIFLPRGAAEWGAIRIRATLAHEYAHIVRRDCLTQLLGDVVVAVHWFNPLAWFARRRMAIERERACDDLVLRDGVRPERYASVLVQTVRGSLLQRNGGAVGALSMARPSELETRLISILDPSRSRGRMSSRAAVATGSIVSAAAVLISVSHLDAAPVAVSDFDAASVSVSHLDAAPVTVAHLDPSAVSVSQLDAVTVPVSPVGEGTAAQQMVSRASLAGPAARLPSLTDSEGGVRLESKAAQEPDRRGDSIAGPLSERVALSPAIWSAARNTAVLRGPDSLLARKLYSQLSGSPSWEGDLVRDRSAWALSRQRGGLLIDPLIESLSDRDWRNRAYAAWALTPSGASRAVPALVALLSDTNWRMRAMAAYALDGIGEESAAAAMARMVNDEAWQVRATAIQFIGSLPDAKYQPLLETALGDRHVAVRLAASEALRTPHSNR